MSGSVVKFATRRLYKVFAVSVVLTLALASAALADEVTNRVDHTSDIAFENITLNEGVTQSVDFRVLMQDNDLDAGCNIDPGEQLTVQVISSTTSVATVSPQTITFTDCNQNQSVTLTAGARGTSTITVAQDLRVGSNTTGIGTFDYTPASFTVTVNSAPTISDIANQSTNEDTATSDIPFTIGDVETLAGNLTVSGSSSNTALVPNSNITFGGMGTNRTVKVTPASNQSGTATITVTVSDGAATTTDTFVLTVNAVNDPPVADLQSITTEEDTSKLITLSASDVDNDSSSLSYKVTSLPTNGKLYKGNSTAAADEITSADLPSTFSGNQVTYLPNANYNGTDSFKFRTNDGVVNSDEVAVSITVNPVNDAPVGDNDFYSVDEDSTLTVSAADGLLKNDTDVENAQLSAVKVGDPAHGSVTLNANGSFIYKPDANYNGSDSFTYKANDGTDDSNVPTVSITVNAVNDAPVASDDAKTTPENTSLVFPASNLVANDSEGAANENGQTLFVSQVNNPQHGTVSLANGQITFTPQTDYNGPASFEYIVCDDGTPQECSTQTATVNVTVSPVNSKPVAQDGTATIDEDSAPTQIDLSTLVSDVETSDANLTYTIVSGPSAQQGTLSGSGPSFTFDSADNFNGTVAIGYKVTDRGDPDNCGAPGPSCEASIESNVKTLTITVNPVNDEPVADDDTATTDEGQPVDMNVKANDTDREGDALTVTGVSDPVNGTATINPDNTVRYVPAADYNGPDSFTYTVSDGHGGTATASVDLTVTAVDGGALRVMTPLPVGKKVSPKAMVAATFSEKIEEASVEAPGVFVLKRGTKTVLATVTYNPDTRTATLDPTKNLRRGATYVVTMTTGVKDMAGNALDQDLNAAGNQGMVWSFKVRR